jgi:molybdopterin-containing oxidoreductase family iron-sulfur binding subunit
MYDEGTSRMSHDRAEGNAVGYDALRRRLEEARGQDYWRSLDELAQSPEFAEFLRHEFPAQAEAWPQALDRRRFLQLMGASFALAGLGACTRQPLEEIVPHVRRPEDVVPGKPQYFATAHTLEGFATGVLVESHDGRPTKVEGNPDHPASLGSTDRLAQATLLDLYDPDRARAVTHLDRIRTWDAFVQALERELARLEPRHGEGLRILSGAVTSPTWEAQMLRLRQRFPKVQWHRWDGVGRDALRDATLTTLGRPVSLRYDLEAADVVVSLESDFLTSGPGCVRHAFDFMRRRRVSEGQLGMNRMYAVESTPTSTGAVADHRLVLHPDQLLGLVYALGYEVGVHGSGVLAPFKSGSLKTWVNQVGDHLRRTAGRNLVVAGEHVAFEVQAFALAINAKIGNFGSTILTSEPVEVEPINQMRSLRQLGDDARGGRVETLLIVGGNPVYDAPADLRFHEALDHVGWSAHLTQSANETSERCHWLVPQAHELEAWSDARAVDGTATVMQPLIEPLFGGKSAHELLAIVSGAGERKPRVSTSQRTGGASSTMGSFPTRRPRR